MGRSTKLTPWQEAAFGFAVLLAGVILVRLYDTSTQRDPALLAAGALLGSVGLAEIVRLEYQRWKHRKER